MGKALMLTNTVTGEFLKASFTAEGQYRIWYVGRNSVLPSNVGNPAQTSSYLGSTSPYKIENDKILMTLSQEPYSYTIYKLGDKYYGARSNEFGYVSYTLQDKPPLFFSPLSKEIMESKKDQAEYVHVSE